MEQIDIRNAVEQLIKINRVEKIALKDLQIIKKIGEGGQATVFKAIYEGQPVAVKFINTIDWKNLAHEIVITANLLHPNIPKFYGIVAEESNPGLIFEYIDGKTLNNMDPLSIPYDFKIKILKDLASVIHLLHTNRIIHRDLKPDNIIIDKVNNVYLIDNGISKVITQRDTKTRTKGTLNYLAPECLISKGESADSVICQITTAVDIWAFGCLTSWLFSGIEPWSDKYKENLVRKALEEMKPFPIPDVITDINIINIITNCTKINLEKRWNTNKLCDFLESI